MHASLKKCLVHLLMLALTLLPLPSAFAMPLAMELSQADAGEHCMSSKMKHDKHAAKSAAGSDMKPSTDSSIDADSAPTACQCCGQCDGDCMGCTTLSAITLDAISIASAASSQRYTAAVTSYSTRHFAPPSRPPLSR